MKCCKKNICHIQSIKCHTKFLQLELYHYHFPSCTQVCIHCIGVVFPSCVSFYLIWLLPSMYHQKYERFITPSMYPLYFYGYVLVCILAHWYGFFLVCILCIGFESLMCVSVFGSLHWLYYWNDQGYIFSPSMS